MSEEYKVIVGYENYSVSNLGNVKNNKTNKTLNPCAHRDGYLSLGLMNNKVRKAFQVHRLVGLTFISPVEGKTCIDHIDNNRKNNCLYNLRWASHRENNHNMSVTKLNTSGHKGVTFNNQLQKWKASIKLDGLQIHLGYFVHKEDAIQARIKKANKIFGVFTNKCERLDV
jgi:hypothetical protein